MKLTTKRLKNLIREELNKISEGDIGPDGAPLKPFSLQQAAQEIYEEFNYQRMGGAYSHSAGEYYFENYYDENYIPMPYETFMKKLIDNDYIYPTTNDKERFDADHYNFTDKVDRDSYREPESERM